jgi:hypothetical protein
MSISEYCWQQMGSNSKLAHSNLVIHDTEAGVSVEWEDANSIQYAATIRKKWKGNDKTKALRWLTRYVLPVSDTALAWRKLLDLYRNSGLFPKTVAKDHAKMLTDWFGINYKKNKRAANFVIYISWKYIVNFSRCPKCGCHECWSEEVCGIQCTNCSATWDDTICPAKWK